MNLSGLFAYYHSFITPIDGGNGDDADHATAAATAAAGAGGGDGDDVCGDGGNDTAFDDYITMLGCYHQSMPAPLSNIRGTS